MVAIVNRGIQLALSHKLIWKTTLWAAAHGNVRLLVDHGEGRGNVDIMKIKA
jgi:hypothetical protein